MHGNISPLLRLSLMLSASALAACESISVDRSEKVSPEAVAKVASGPADVIVVFDATSGQSGQGLSAWDKLDLSPEDRAQFYQEKKRAVLEMLEVDRVRDFSRLPLIAVAHASQAELAALAARPEVSRIEEDAPHEHFLTESLGLINQAGAAALGDTGAGAGIAILDTGVTYTNSAFGTCSAPGDSGCKVAFAQDFAPDDGSLDDNGHGTNVAAISLGVAPGATILALDVFRTDGLAYSSDILAAIDWVIQNKSTYNIQAMNMSLGGGGSTSACGSDVFASAIASAKSAGVLSAIASGNNGYTNKIASPGCVPAAVSVGAVYDSSMGGIQWSGCTDNTIAADQVTCFSNSASFLTILAPGALITAAGVTMGGTSQASPHVAGAIAVARIAFPNETVDQTVSRLTSSGVSITDPRNQVTKPRLALTAAMNASTPSPSATPTPTPTPTPSTPPVDRTAPTGSVVIAGGATAVRATAVTLTLAATDPSGVTNMCVSNTTSCTSWRAFARTLSWTLSTGTGTKMVYVKYRDALGNAMVSPVTDTIILDTTAPTQGTLAATVGTRQLSLSWSGFADRGSGINHYVAAGMLGRTAPSNCNSHVVYNGTNTSFTHTGLTGGSAYSYRVCAVDNAGNTSAGVTRTATPNR
ncbi:MAG: S8 family serine peptidase [Myxococcota bacterium]